MCQACGYYFQKIRFSPLHVCAINKVVDEENVVAGDGSAEELDEAEVLATTDNGKALLELGHLTSPPKLNATPFFRTMHMQHTKSLPSSPRAFSFRIASPTSPLTVVSSRSSPKGFAGSS
jgi:hypothetical protein